MSVWLVGAGSMAQDYGRVLHALGCEYEAVGRGANSAEQFTAATGHPIRQGGVTRALHELGAPPAAIVAVGVDHLAGVAIELIEAGTRRLLLEKPGGLGEPEIRAVRDAAQRHGARVLLGYNRRFYASTAKVREMIAEDGGLISCVFEFTEWAHVVAPQPTPAAIKRRWFLANSTHVVDLAFHLCGLPADWRAWHGGRLDWHPSAARFSGAGVTDQGVSFSYHADWEAPGRWGIELLTRRRRLILRPMEQLQVTALGSVRIEPVVLDDQADNAFKPGLMKQTEAFLRKDDAQFCDIDAQLRHCVVYEEMAGYGRSDE